MSCSFSSVSYTHLDVYKRQPMNVSPTTASLFIVAPLAPGQMFRGLFSTHPPLEKRIAALKSMVITPSGR